MTPSSVTAFAPATVGNVVCGFDVLGLALDEPGDRVTAVRRDEPGVDIVRIRGDDGRIPREADRNSAGVAAAALLERHDLKEGVGIDLEKGLPLSGGMGGSAASAVAAVVAVNALLDLGADDSILLECALEGEKVASGSAHADNVAPCLMGGIVLVRRGARRPAVSIHVPPGLSVALLHPRVEVATRDARAVLPEAVPLGDAITQWGNTAALVAGLYREDLELIADALVDRVAEPARSGQVPGFEAVRRAAMEAGAVGFGISGAGPSMMALCGSVEGARTVGAAMEGAFVQKAISGAGEAELFVSPVSIGGARVLDSDGRGGFAAPEVSRRSVETGDSVETGGAMGSGEQDAR
ncbi:MAG: homoserine kinase [bacterium]